MSSISMSGSDTIKINSRILADLASGDVGVLTFPNELANIKTGKNGNSIYSFNETGRQAELSIRLLRGSSDDKYLSSQLASMKNNFAGFTLMTGELIKRIGDGTGKIISDTYIMSGGVFSKELDAKSNTDGDSEQSLVTYVIRYSNSPRIIE